MTSPANTTPGTTPARGRTPARPLAVAGATLAALAVWAVAVPVLGVDLLVDSAASTRTVGPATVAATSAAAGLAGWTLLALLEHLTERARTVWTAIAVVVLLASLGGPLTAGTTTAAQAVLSLLHLTVAAVLIGGLPHPAAGTARRPR